jgi:EF hand domain-containing protein
MNARALLAILAAATVIACADAEKERLIRTTVPTYDAATGRLKQLTYDADRNGRVDTWTSMDGTRPLFSRIDRNEDGKIDRWEYYSDTGALVKVGFSRKEDGNVDAWAFSGSSGQVERIEFSSTGKEDIIDRREYYLPSHSDTSQPTLVRAEVDADNDGRIDRWETYEDGAIRTIAYDQDGDGVPDRRLTYAHASLVLIESDPDGSGGFATRRRVTP